MPYEQYETESNSVQPRVFLQPIAAPSILGLYGLAGATFMVAARSAHWFGSGYSMLLLVPFAALFGGLAQFVACRWAYKARDGLATAVHGMWGAFWMAYGALIWMISSGRAPAPTGAGFSELGYWFIVVGAISWSCTAAASKENKALATVLVFLSAGSTVEAIGLLTASESLNILGAYLFIIAALAAWYTGTALLLNETYGREVLSLGRLQRARELPTVTAGIREPGVIRGQA